MKHCVESHRSDPNRVVSSFGKGLQPEGDTGTGLVWGMGYLKWRVLCMPYYEWVDGQAGREDPSLLPPTSFLGLPHLLSNALGRPQLQKRQLPATSAAPAQVLL